MWIKFLNFGPSRFGIATSGQKINDDNDKLTRQEMN